MKKLWLFDKAGGLIEIIDVPNWGVTPAVIHVGDRYFVYESVFQQYRESIAWNHDKRILKINPITK
jgi:hypothetical protein